MYYSLTFANTKNTWTDWGLIPESPPTVAPPSPKLNFVDIPGRVKVPIDLSLQPWNKILYERTSGSWTFIKELKAQTDRVSTYEAIRYWLHGRTCTVMLEDDPTHYYKGVFTVSDQQSGPNMLRISIGYNLEPVRYNVSNDSIDSSYIQDWGNASPNNGG